MAKKTLFIQPFYFYAGHYFQAFNNFIYNIRKIDRYDFLVSVNNDVNNKSFYIDFKKILKLKKIYTFKSSKNSFSKINIFKSFLYIIKNRNSYENFFFYDCKIFTLTYLFFFTSYLFKSNNFYIYAHYGPEFLNKSIFKNFFLINFLKKKNTKIFLRTKELQKDWINKLPIYKNKIKYLKSIDYPDLKYSKSINRNKKIVFGCVGQIRNGKSLKFLNNFFKLNKKYQFKIIGSFANDEVKNSFKFIDEKFLTNNKFLNYNKLVNTSKKLDYIVLLYDNFFDKRYEVSTLYLAIKLNIPVICFDDGSWLSKKIKSYNCGLTIKNLSKFDNFPNRYSKKYKELIKNLEKFNISELNIDLDIKRLKRLF